MKMVMNLYLKGLKRAGKRIIWVNDRISLKDFCEYVIVSMNGNCKHLYQLTVNEMNSYLCNGCSIIDDDCEEMMNDLTLGDIDLSVGDVLMVNYDFRSDWEFILEVDKIEQGCCEKDFKVIDGSGVGILEDCYGVFILKQIVTPNISKDEIEIFSSRFSGFDEYINKKFDVDANNREIDEYKEKIRELVRPKHYIMNVGLHGFDKEIKRKISVDSNVGLDSFCRGLIVSMRGDLSHSYGIKIGKSYLDDEIIDSKDLNFLQLKQKQKLKVIYDFGDKWTFNITISKVVDGYGDERRFNVLSGCGYGIVDDCGSIWGLEKIFDGTCDDFGTYDINDFNIDDINKKVSRVI